MTGSAVAGAIGVWGHLDSLPERELRSYVSTVAELGYGCLWVPETVGREPYVLLAAVIREAGDRMRLGTAIASIWGHDAQSTKMAALTLHELTGGRFVLGLGVSHAHLAQKLRGHTYDRPLTRMREFLDGYERLPYRGPRITGSDGEPSEPPIVLAALRERMLQLAAQRAHGAFPYLVTVEWVAWMRGVLDGAAFDAGRSSPKLIVSLPVVLESDPRRASVAARGYLAPYLRTPNYQASWALQGFAPEDWAQPGSDRLIDAMVAWGDADALGSRVRAMHVAGASEVALIPLSPDGVTEHLPTLTALAPG